MSETDQWNVVLFLDDEAYMQVESFRAFVKALLDVGCLVYLPNILCINISSHLISFRELASFQKSWTLNFDWINIFWTHSLSKAYPVIGVMEHLDKSLRVFERRLPTFFGGIHDIYYRELKGVFFFIWKLKYQLMSEPHKNIQRKRVNISQEAKQALLYNLKEEQVKSTFSYLWQIL